VPVDYTAFWYWLKAMFGDPATTGTGPYTHTFKVAATQPSLVLDKQFTDIGRYWKYNGVKVSSFGIDFGGDGELVANLDIVGANETPSATPYDASPTAQTLNRLGNFQAAMTEGGSAFAKATSLSLNFNFGLDTGIYCIGDAGQRSDLPEGIVEATGTLLALFEDHTLVDKAVASTESEITLTLTSGTNSLAFELPELQYSRAKAPIEGPQGIIQELNYVAYYDDDADASTLIATLINDDEHP
jgi:hypothetical protein